MTRTASLLLLVAAACSTTPSPPPTQASARADDDSVALTDFSARVAASGMSVAAPARVCVAGVDDVSAPKTCEAAWDDDVGCVVEPACRAPSESALKAYARALVKAHVPDAKDARGDALVEAYVAHDDAKLATLAQAVEADFDARRAKAKPVKVTREPPKPKRVVEKKPATVSADVADAGPAEEKAALLPEDGVDGGPLGPSLKERIVGTWTYEEGPLRNAYSLCDDGNYVIRYEVIDEEMAFVLQDLPTVHGHWVAKDGDPPTIDFVVFGEEMTAPIAALTDEILDVTLDGDAIHLERRSKTADCN